MTFFITISLEPIWHRRKSFHARNLGYAQKPIILTVMADPEPNIIFSILHRGSAIVNADTNRPKAANFFETKGGMTRRQLEQRVIFVGELPDRFWKFVIVCPEFLSRPKSRNASSANASRRPALTSSSNCLSQASASNSLNHALKVESSSRESLAMADSISRTVPMRSLFFHF